jgi:type IV fimbrial biogenesis protein FimT
MKDWYMARTIAQSHALTGTRDMVARLCGGRRFDSSAAEYSAALREVRRNNASHRLSPMSRTEDAMTQLPTTTSKRRQSGVTLIETAMAACVSGVLAASALPSLSSAIEAHRLTTTTNDLVLAVNLARSTATVKRTRVVLAPLVDADWTSGWRVFVDNNNDGKLDSGEDVVRDFTAAPNGVTITPHFGSSYSGDYLSFDNVGNLRRTTSGGFVLGRMMLKNADGFRSLCFSALQVRAVRAEECT